MLYLPRPRESVFLRKKQVMCGQQTVIVIGAIIQYEPILRPQSTLYLNSFLAHVAQGIYTIIEGQTSSSSNNRRFTSSNGY